MIKSLGSGKNLFGTTRSERLQRGPSKTREKQMTARVREVDQQKFVPEVDKKAVRDTQLIERAREQERLVSRAPVALQTFLTGSDIQKKFIAKLLVSNPYGRHFLSEMIVKLDRARIANKDAREIFLRNNNIMPLAGGTFKISPIQDEVSRHFLIRSVTTKWTRRMALVKNRISHLPQDEEFLKQAGKLTMRKMPSTHFKTLIDGAMRAPAPLRIRLLWQVEEFVSHAQGRPMRSFVPNPHLKQKKLTKILAITQSSTSDKYFVSMLKDATQGSLKKTKTTTTTIVTVEPGVKPLALLLKQNEQCYADQESAARTGPTRREKAAARLLEGATTKKAPPKSSKKIIENSGPNPADFLDYCDEMALFDKVREDEIARKKLINRSWDSDFHRSQLNGNQGSYSNTDDVQEDVWSTILGAAGFALAVFLALAKARAARRAREIRLGHQHSPDIIDAVADVLNDPTSSQIGSINGSSNGTDGHPKVQVLTGLTSEDAYSSVEAELERAEHENRVPARTRRGIKGAQVLVDEEYEKVAEQSGCNGPELEDHHPRKKKEKWHNAELPTCDCEIKAHPKDSQSKSINGSFVSENAHIFSYIYCFILGYIFTTTIINLPYDYRVYGPDNSRTYCYSLFCWTKDPPPALPNWMYDMPDAKEKPQTKEKKKSPKFKQLGSTKGSVTEGDDFWDCVMCNFIDTLIITSFTMLISNLILWYSFNDEEGKHRVFDSEYLVSQYLEKMGVEYDVSVEYILRDKVNWNSLKPIFATSEEFFHGMISNHTLTISFFFYIQSLEDLTNEYQEDLHFIMERFFDESPHLDGYHEFASIATALFESYSEYNDYLHCQYLRLSCQSCLNEERTSQKENCEVSDPDAWDVTVIPLVSRSRNDSNNPWDGSLGSPHGEATDTGWVVGPPPIGGRGAGRGGRGQAGRGGRGGIRGRGQGPAQRNRPPPAQREPEELPVELNHPVVNLRNLVGGIRPIGGGLGELRLNLNDPNEARNIIIQDDIAIQDNQSQATQPFAVPQPIMPPHPIMPDGSELPSSSSSSSFSSGDSDEDDLEVSTSWAHKISNMYDTIPRRMLTTEQVEFMDGKRTSPSRDESPWMWLSITFLTSLCLATAIQMIVIALTDFLHFVVFFSRSTALTTVLLESSLPPHPLRHLWWGPFILLLPSMSDFANRLINTIDKISKGTFGIAQALEITTVKIKQIGREGTLDRRPFQRRTDDFLTREKYFSMSVERRTLNSSGLTVRPNSTFMEEILRALLEIFISMKNALSWATRGRIKKYVQGNSDVLIMEECKLGSKCPDACLVFPLVYTPESLLKSVQMTMDSIQRQRLVNRQAKDNRNMLAYPYYIASLICPRAAESREALNPPPSQVMSSM